MKLNWIESKINSFQIDDDFKIDSIMLTIAENVSIALNKNKNSRSTFANKLGVSPAYVTKLLRGEQNLTVNSLYKISKVLKINVVDLFRNLPTITDAPLEKIQNIQALTIHPQINNFAISFELQHVEENKPDKIFKPKFRTTQTESEPIYVQEY